MRRGRGFTLIELLVVLAVIATLLTIAVPNYFRHIERAREASLRESLAVMRDALDKYRADTGGYPERLDDLVSRRYLRRVPVDPLTDRDDSWTVVPPPDNADTGTVWDIHSGAEGTALDGSEYRSW